MRLIRLFGVLIVLTATMASAQPSLQVLDPQQGWRTQQGTIEDAVISVRPKGAYLEYGLYLTLSARDSGLPSGRQLEIEFFFDLPPGSIVTDSWLWVEDEIMQALIIDRWTAAEIYEGIVNRRRDPSILFKRGENRYELRVYPLLLGEERKVKITYLVPAELVGGSAQASLPLDLLAASRLPVPNLEVLAWASGSWSAPSILGSAKGTDFEAREIGNLGPHYHRSLEGEELLADGILSFSIPVPFRDGVYFAAEHSQEGGFYQVILEPSAQFPSQGPRHVVMMIDHDASNASLSRSSVAEAARAALITSLSDGDYFNLFVSQLQVGRYAEGWTLATTEAIDDAFDTVGAPADYSSLPALMQAGLEFAAASAEPPTLVLVTSSDAFTSASVADRLLEDLRFSDFNGTVQILDYQDRNQGQYRVGGIWYRGNGYLYAKLAQTGGGALTQMETASQLGAILPRVILTRGRDLAAIDLTANLANGFTFDRITNVQPGESRALAEPLVQTGQFVGDPPFNVTFSGTRQQDAFSILIEIPPEAVLDGGPSLRQAWVGQRIHQLEQQSQSDEVINEIITLSLSNRILSEYTAFLALEPSDTTRACTDCVDETTLVSIEVQDELPQADSLLQVYPNPVVEGASILIRIPESIRNEPTELVLYDLLGRAVRTFRLRPHEVTQTIQWDRLSDQGVRVASGVYVLALRIGARARSVSVVAY